jgi:hypothetical protein
MDISGIAISPSIGQIVPIFLSGRQIHFVTDQCKILDHNDLCFSIHFWAVFVYIANIPDRTQPFMLVP